MNDFGLLKSIGTKNKEEVLSNINNALKLSPQSCLITLMIGRYYEDYKDYDNAIKNYELTIKIDSTQMFAYMELASVYHELAYINHDINSQQKQKIY